MAASVVAPLQRQPNLCAKSSVSSGCRHHAVRDTNPTRAAANGPVRVPAQSNQGCKPTCLSVRKVLGRLVKAALGRSPRGTTPFLDYMASHGRHCKPQAVLVQHQPPFSPCCHASWKTIPRPRLVGQPEVIGLVAADACLASDGVYGPGGCSKMRREIIAHRASGCLPLTHHTAQLPRCLAADFAVQPYRLSLSLC